MAGTWLQTWQPSPLSSAFKDQVNWTYCEALNHLYAQRHPPSERKQDLSLEYRGVSWHYNLMSWQLSSHCDEKNQIVSCTHRGGVPDFGRPNTSPRKENVETEILITFWSRSLVLPFALPRYMGPLISSVFSRKSKSHYVIRDEVTLEKKSNTQGQGKVQKGHAESL